MRNSVWKWFERRCDTHKLWSPVILNCYNYCRCRYWFPCFCPKNFKITCILSAQDVNCTGSILCSNSVQRILILIGCINYMLIDDYFSIYSAQSWLEYWSLVLKSYKDVLGIAKDYHQSTLLRSMVVGDIVRLCAIWSMVA